MPYLKEVTINNNKYFYLFHTVRDGDKYKKLSKYLGKNKPSDEKLEELKIEFLKEMNKEPIEFDSKEEKGPNVIAILQDLQEDKGYLNKDDMIKLSKELDIPGIDIYGVATFYSQFKLKPSGKYTVSMCTGTACHVKGSNTLLDYLSELLGIKVGETTKDGKITLEGVNCIGACAKAPAMMVNETVYGELDKKETKKIIDALE